MLSEFSVYSSIILQPCISNQETSNSSFMVLREEILVRGIQVAQQSDAAAAGTEEDAQDVQGAAVWSLLVRPFSSR